RCVVVGQSLTARNVADRAKCRLADLAHALRNNVGRGKNLFGLLVEQQVVVAEMRSADVPVKILGFQVQRETVGEEAVESAGDIFRGIGAEIGGGRNARGRAAGDSMIHGESSF